MARHLGIFGLCAGLALLATAPARADDNFAVIGVHVDATAASATEARDMAIAQGRAPAWAKLYRRLTRAKDWPRQPQLADDVLLKMIRGFEISGEKRSSTRYLADITYNFNAPDVRRVLQQAGIPYSEAGGRHVLVIPIVGGAAKPFDPASPWTQAWAQPDIARGLIPFVLPTGDATDMLVLSRLKLEQANWISLAPLATRYGASEVLIATAAPSSGGIAVSVVHVSPAGASPAQSSAAQPSYAAAASSIVTAMNEGLKSRSAVDYGMRSTLRVAVTFSSGREWNSIRARLTSVSTVANVSIVGLTLTNAEIDISYVGQLTQLHDALAQQNLTLGSDQGVYSLSSASAETP